MAAGSSFGRAFKNRMHALVVGRRAPLLLQAAATETAPIAGESVVDTVVQLAQQHGCIIKL